MSAGLLSVEVRLVGHCWVLLLEVPAGVASRCVVEECPFAEAADFEALVASLALDLGLLVANCRQASYSAVAP